MLKDLQIGFRLLKNNPAFSLLSILALAVGIGANAAIFSVVNSVLLRALPYPDDERLTMVWLDNRIQGWHEDITSYPNYRDWRDRNNSFENMAAFRTRSYNLTGEGDPSRIAGAEVSANFFATMKVSPSFGRTFRPEEEAPEHDLVALLSEGFWRERFGGDPSVLGRKLTLNTRSVEIVGVMPSRFQFPENAQIWTPLAPGERTRESRGNLWLPVIGRLKPTVTLAAAQSDMDGVARALEEEFPEVNKGYGINLVPLRRQVSGEIRPSLLILMGSVGLVLLIACANVANLFLARASARQREIAIRAAVGASRFRILRQLLSESLVLALAGGTLGLALAYGGLRFLVANAPSSLPRASEIGVDLPVLGFLLATCLAAALLFGLAPALSVSSPNLNETLREGGRGGGSGVRGTQTRRVLIVAETALSLILLISAGLLLRSFWQLQGVDPGFAADHLLSFRVSLSGSSYTEARQVSDFFQQLQERLEALPGVRSAGAASAIFIPALTNSTTFVIEGEPPKERQELVEVTYDSATPGFFKTLGARLVQGRDFNQFDTAEAPRVAILNETMARRFWPNQNPIGKRFKYGDADSRGPWREIVGVVADIRRSGIDRDVRPSTFLPHAQVAQSFMTVAIRTESDPLTIWDRVRATVWSLDPTLPLFDVSTANRQIAESLAGRRFNLALLAGFAALALLLAAIGLYGVISYAVTRKTHDIGVRMALGANRWDVLSVFLREGLLLGGLGVLLGLVGARLLTGLMAGLLFGISPYDPTTFAALGAALLLVALLASYLPARRATRIDPLKALRYE